MKYFYDKKMELFKVVRMPGNSTTGEQREPGLSRCMLIGFEC
jgi:hypothetical protein